MSISRFKLVVAMILGVLPPSRLKNVFYHWFLGYSISRNVHLGISLLLCEHVSIARGTFIGNFNIILDNKKFIMHEGAKITRFNLIKGLSSVVLEEESFIGDKNEIYGRYHERLGPEYGNFHLASRSIITNSHVFNMTDNIAIGEETVIGGKGSQFWTHGFDIDRNFVQGEIRIGSKCYIASAVRVNPGVSIPDNTIVGLGTVVSKSIPHAGFWVSNELTCKSRDVVLSVRPGLEKIENKANGKEWYRKGVS